MSHAILFFWTKRGKKIVNFCHAQSFICLKKYSPQNCTFLPHPILFFWTKYTPKFAYFCHTFSFDQNVYKLKTEWVNCNSTTEYLCHFSSFLVRSLHIKQWCKWRHILYLPLAFGAVAKSSAVASDITTPLGSPLHSSVTLA